MKYCFYMCLLMGILVFSCEQNTSTATNSDSVDYSKELKGTWQTTQINVAVNSADGLDSFRTEYLTEDIWEQQFGMQPPKYYFGADQKYRVVHETMGGKLSNETRGLWNVFGDTLMLIEANATYKYMLRGRDGRLSFRAFIDWDGDGEEDDEYQSVQRKISIAAE